MKQSKLEKEIEEILERTCGFECQNGAENIKPALKPLLSLFTSRLKRLREGVQEIKEDSFYIGYRVHELRKDLDRVLALIDSFDESDPSAKLRVKEENDYP